MAQSLAATASMNLETDPELSLLLVTESVRTMSEANETVLPLSNTVLRQLITKWCEYYIGSAPGGPLEEVTQPGSLIPRDSYFEFTPTGPGFDLGIEEE